MAAIDVGKPIPKKKGGRRPQKYPWHEMNVGDSILVRKYAICSANEWAKRNRPGWHFIIRKDGEFFRIWREA